MNTRSARLIWAGGAGIALCLTELGGRLRELALIRVESSTDTAGVPAGTPAVETVHDVSVA